MAVAHDGLLADNFPRRSSTAVQGLLIPLIRSCVQHPLFIPALPVSLSHHSSRTVTASMCALSSFISGQFGGGKPSPEQCGLGAAPSSRGGLNDGINRLSSSVEQGYEQAGERPWGGGGTNRQGGTAGRRAGASSSLDQGSTECNWGKQAVAKTGRRKE